MVEQATLYKAYQADTSRGEALYDRRVREFLFGEGINHPFSQPASPATAAVPSHGVVQAVRYAHDDGKPTMIDSMASSLCAPIPTVNGALRR